MTKPIVALLTLAGLFSASEAEAQFFRRGHARQSMTSASPAPMTAAPAAAGQVAESRVYPYSYYASRTLPARTYVGYGAEDFPFQGVPYGHLYDPWTWPYMSGSYSRGLARYYDPPVK